MNHNPLTPQRPEVSYLLTVRQAAKYLNLGINRTYELVRREENPLPSIRFNNTIRIPVRALEEWIGRQTRG